MKYVCLSALIILSLSACVHPQQTADNQAAKDTIAEVRVDTSVRMAEPPVSITDSTRESGILDSVFALPEVKAWGVYLEEQTHGERHMKLWVQGQPQTQRDPYWIKVGEDNGMTLVAQFNFFVYPDSMRIMYYDTANDSELTLDQWRSTSN